MNEQEETIKRLSFENYIWVIYIFIAIGNIVGDELIKKSIIEHDEASDKLAKNIFTISLVITVIIYLYFLARNYSDKEKHQDDDVYEIRFIGSIFLIVGILCFLYFQIKTSYSNDTVSSI